MIFYEEIKYYAIFAFQVHPKTSVEDQDELSSLLQVPVVVSQCLSECFFLKKNSFPETFKIMFF